MPVQPAHTDFLLQHPSQLVQPENQFTVTFSEARQSFSNTLKFWRYFLKPQWLSWLSGPAHRAGRAASSLVGCRLNYLHILHLWGRGDAHCHNESFLLQKDTKTVKQCEFTKHFQLWPLVEQLLILPKAARHLTQWLKRVFCVQQTGLFLNVHR